MEDNAAFNIENPVHSNLKIFLKRIIDQEK